MSAESADRYGPIFDADHHYWESRDAFTRYRDPKFKDRGVRIAEHEGVLRYFVGDRLHPNLPGPGDAHRRPAPGILFDYFAGREAIDQEKHVYNESPADHPEWFNRDARLISMNQQGVEAAWMFPSHGVCIEGPMQPDREAALHILSAFNRWIDDEWGFAYQNRIFAVPLLSLSDVDLAITELDWVTKRGARVIAIRNGPAYTAHGNKSPADPMFDRFWARVEEAGVVVTAHAGFDDGYTSIDKAVGAVWGVDHDEDKISSHVAGGVSFDNQLIMMIMKKRLVHDFAAVIVTHGLFERFPRLKFAFIENGALWVGPLLHDLHVVHMQNRGMFKTNPVDQFHRNCWVAPFVEDDAADLAKHIPIVRILFGSDWPHAEGLHSPADYYASLSTFADSDVRRIMAENTRQLTFA